MTDGTRVLLRFWSKFLIMSVFAVLLKNAVPVLADEAVTIEPQSESLTVRIKGEEFTVFHFGPAVPKPYFWPVRASDGAILTRPIDPDQKEHPHHRGVWLAVDEVNDIKFWAERGKIVTREVTSTSGNPATIDVKNDWIGRDSISVMTERTRISIFPNRLLVYDVTLAPPLGGLVRFDDTKEGFLGIRIAESMREIDGGTIKSSEGNESAQACWGRTAKWVDYVGNVQGKRYGVTLMDHPNNFRPSRYHVRDYGLFSISPFGEGVYQADDQKSKPVILDDVTPMLNIRYGLFIHHGNAEEGMVPAAYSEFLSMKSQIPH